MGNVRLSTDFLGYNLNDLNLLFSKILSNHRQTLQWEILFHEVSGKDEDKHRIDEAGDGGREVLIGFTHANEEEKSELDYGNEELHR